MPSSVLTELLREEAQRRGLIGVKSDEWARLEAETFPKQRAFIEHEGRFSTLCTPRRAAKTETIIRKLLRKSKRMPGSRSVYISMTRDNAKRNVWGRLQTMVARYSLGLIPNHTELILRDPTTRSETWVTGLANEKELAKLRGNSYDYVHVDEVQDILIDFESFILSVITPALGDRRGQLSVSGTPDPHRRNQWWYHARNSEGARWKKWQKFGWLLTDNVFFPEPEAYLREIREQEGFTEDDPRYQAEYLGLWTNSKTNLCIDSYEPSRNDFGGDWQAATAGYQFLLGLDPGYKDATAYVVIAYSVSKRHMLIVESLATSNTVVSDMAVQAKKFMAKYPITYIVCDEQGMGKTVAEELVQRFGLPIIPAEKKDKRMRLAFMNSDLRLGKLQVVPSNNLALITQWNSVMWDSEHQREQEGQVCDLFDAAGYAHIACRSYFEAEPEASQPDAGDAYWAEKIERARAEREGWEFE